jgi:hypothetical protein
MGSVNLPNYFYDERQWKLIPGSFKYILFLLGSLERIVDIFLALAVATRHESRLYKLVSFLD